MYLFLLLKRWQSSMKCTVPFSFAVPLFSLAVTHCHLLSLFVTDFHSLSLVVIRCHSLYHSLSLVVIRCHSLYHSLSLVVPLVVTRCHSLSLVVNRCITRLSFYKRSILNINLKSDFHFPKKIIFSSSMEGI